MTTALVLHKVADYDAWRPVYDEFDDVRESMGVTHDEVMRSQDDPQLVIVRHDFEDRSAADAFLQDKRLHDVMHKAGVDESTLEIHIADPA